MKTRGIVRDFFLAHATSLGIVSFKNNVLPVSRIVRKQTLEPLKGWLPRCHFFFGARVSREP